MDKWSLEEEIADKQSERTYIDAYPDIEKFRRNDFMRYLDFINTDFLVKRKNVTRLIDNREKAQHYQETIRKKMQISIGPLPEGNAKRAFVTETLEREGYRVDKLYIETLPDYYATANFYYPTDAKTPLPALLFLCGHAPEGKASVTYVSFCVEAVLNGFCVLTFDVVGQGERKVRKEGNDDAAWMNPVEAHCLLDQKLSLTGEHLGAYMMRDNVKALDYLLSRPEVDSERVGVAGNSGGGTMAAYMGAYDDRIKAVAPCCYITELRSLLHRIMAQDAEQCLPGFMRQGLNHSDFITAAAPKPYFIGAALFDFFPIDGVRDAFIEAKAMYRLLGFESGLELYVSLKGHGLWHDMRENVLRFFCRSFSMAFIENKKIDYEQLPDAEDLQCEVGDVAASFKRKSLHHLIRERAGAPHEQSKKKLPHGFMRDRLMQALKLPQDFGEPAGAMKNSLCIEEDGTFAFEYEAGRMRITGAWRQLTERPGCVLIAVGETELENVLTAKAGEYEAIMTIHPRGTGPAALDPQSSFGLFDPETASAYNARMLGMTLQGMRVMDVLMGISRLRQLPGYEHVRILLHGQEEHALTALYAAVIAEIHDVCLKHLPVSFRAFQIMESHRWKPVIFVPVLSQAFDVEDLLQALRPGNIRIDGFLDPMKHASL